MSWNKTTCVSFISITFVTKINKEKKFFKVDDFYWELTKYIIFLLFSTMLVQSPKPPPTRCKFLKTIFKVYLVFRMSQNTAICNTILLKFSRCQNLNSNTLTRTFL